jgi:cytochrome oxidase Cu insertion factor (SCO1/SenC/PrrC family)
MMSRKDAWPLGAIGFILAVSVAWWTLALWSVPGAPEWLERTRSVCFNLTETGLPDAKGWLLLIGQPPTMFAFLMVGWGEDVRSSLRRLAGSRAGRLAVLGTATMLLVAATGAVAKVRDARLPEIAIGLDEAAPDTYPRLERPWPAVPGLVDQHGRAFDLASLGERAAFVTFAFGHCATICPAVVHQARAARLAVERDISIVVVTLDPWRDTPTRLPDLVDQFALDTGRDFVVGGGVEAVNEALDAWGIPRERDLRTGDIVHPGIVYLVEPGGTIAYGVTGGPLQLESLARRLH